MWWITDRLALGQEKDAQDWSALTQAGITHIVNCAVELPCTYEDRLHYLHLGMNDPDHRFGDVLPRAFATIDKALHHGGRVLVHCRGGISRSPAVVLAYLCHSGLTLDDAVRHVAHVVPTRPNDPFLRYLLSHYPSSMTLPEMVDILMQT